MADMHLVARVEEKGLRELGEAMRNLAQKMNLRIAAQATGAAAGIIKREAKNKVKANPSYQTGSLYDAVIAKKIPRRQSEYTSEHIVTVRGRGTKKQRGREAAKGKKVARVTYGHILEFGTVNMPAEPFLRPGFESGKTRAKDAMIAKLRAGIEKASK